MSGAGDGTASATRRSGRRLWLTIALGLGLLLAGLVVGLRYGVLLPQARLLIEAATDGLKVGRFGRLRIEGLAGDVWTDLRIAKLTLRDEKGVWLEAENVHIKWRYLQLLRRNFKAEDIAVENLRLIRRPTLSPAGKEAGTPIAFHIDHAHGRLEMLPAFSYRRGLFDVDLALQAERDGAKQGRLRAASRLHPGDHLSADFDVASNRPLLIRIEAEEAQGGAIAGALGLPADQPFLLRIAADGRSSRGGFIAVARSGETRPLEAQGAWSEAGGEARGRLSLTASELTASLARRLGPELQFALAGRKAAPKLLALRAQVSSENLRLVANGLGDLGERRLGPQGLFVSAATPNFARFMDGPVQGSAAVSGTLRQLNGGWRFAGQSSFTRNRIGAYSLEQASGPITLTADDGELVASASLAGVGGRGAGWVAAALGGAPSASFEGARLADGRLALRRMTLSGAGLQLEASGGRGLLGRLSFEGKARLSNLAAARSGAGGAADLGWSATQARAGQAWNFLLDARGQRFATGYPEIDRLLGPRPQMKAKANLQDRRLAVAEARLVGAAMQATTAGVLEQGRLNFKVGWTASGPFVAGPVEITGRTRGSGAVTGTLREPRADLTARLDTLDIPRLPLADVDVTLTFQRRADGAAGMIAATGMSRYGPARGRSAFRFPQTGVDLTDLSVDAGGLKASGALSLRRGAPSSANLDLRVTRGAFLDAGQISGRVLLGPQSRLQLAAANARFPGSPLTVRSGRLSGEGTLARLPYALSADGGSDRGRWSAHGRGILSQAQPGYSASFEGAGRLAGRDLQTTEPALFRFSGAERNARLRLAASDGGRIYLDSRFTPRTAEVRAQLRGLSLALLDEDFAGRFDAAVVLQGQGGRLDGALDAKLANARGRGAPAASAVDGTVRGRLDGRALVLSATASNAQGLQANADLTIPALASAAPFRLALAQRQPLRGRFFAAGEVRPLWDLLVGGERSLSGRVRTQGVLGGTLADPKPVGDLAIDNGRFEDGVSGLSLRQVTLRASFEQDAIDVTQASGFDGHGGSVSGMGRINLVRETASSFRLDLRKFRLIDNDEAVASASGTATITRAADGKAKLSGVLTIDEAHVTARLPASGVVIMDVVEKNRSPDLPASLPPQRARGEGWALDVALRAPRGVFLRGRGLDVELSLDAQVGGTTSHPQLAGVARVVRGDYDFAGKRFEFDPQSVVYLATDPQDIRLDLLAVREDPSLTADVRIRGTAAKPEVTLSSTPSLPSDEVLSQVLFGTSAAQLSPIEAAQLASTFSVLAGGGGLDVIGNLRTFAGLDRLALAGGAATGFRFSGGKYLTRDVYLELAGGPREGPTAQVEWRLRRNLSLVSKLAGQGGGRLSIRWRRDY